jgi:hypothetical protein
MSNSKQRRGLSRPPRQPADAESFIESARTAGTAESEQPKAEEPAKRRHRKEPVHTFNIRMPVSEFDRLQSWAEQVSPRDSVHALVLKAVREKLERLEDGTDTE